jgi:hypothetical protein
MRNIKELESKFEDLEKRVWICEHPPKFKKGDLVIEKYSERELLVLEYRIGMCGAHLKDYGNQYLLYDKNQLYVCHRFEDEIEKHVI